MSWNFDGTDDRAVVTDNAALTLPAGDWTIGGWIKITSNAGTQFQYIFSWGTIFATPSCNIFLRETSIGADADHLVVECRDASGDGTLGTGGHLWTSGSGTSPGASTAWQHVVLRNSGTSLAIIVNGTQLAAVTTTNFGEVNVAGNLFLGARNDLAADRWFNGQMADWFKINRALNSSELTALTQGMPAWRLAGIGDSTSWYIPMRMGGASGDYTEYINRLTVTNTGSTDGTSHAPLAMGYRLQRASTPFVADTNTPMTADSGSATFTGQAATLTWDRALTAESGTATFTGQDTAFVFGTILTAESGTASFTGQDVAFARSFTAETGVATFTGQDAGLVYDRALTAESGTATFTGQDAAFVFGSVLTAESATATLTGQDVTLTFAGDFILTADTAAATFTGQDTGLTWDRQIVADSGTATFTGQDTGLVWNRQLTAETGTATFTGHDTALSLAGNFTLTAESGSATFTGQDTTLTLTAGETLTADSGVCTFTGQDATTTFGGDHTMTAQSGVCTFSGQAAILTLGGMAIIVTDPRRFTGTLPNTRFRGVAPSTRFSAEP